MAQHFWEHIPADRRLFRIAEPIWQGFPPSTAILGFPCNSLEKTEIVNGKIEKLPPLSQLPSITTLPADTKHFYCYLAAESDGYLQSLISTGIPNQLESLMIGWQGENKPYLAHFSYEDSFDYAACTQLLSAAIFPTLSYFMYGLDELFVNENMLCGNLGNLTTVLQQMPALQELHLYGIFILDEPIQLKQLKKLCVDVTWVLDGIGSISNETLIQLFHSSFPNLESITLNLDILESDNEIEYTLNTNFFNNLPHLRTVILNGNFNEESYTELQTLLSTKGIQML